MAFSLVPRLPDFSMHVAIMCGCSAVVANHIHALAVMLNPKKCVLHTQLLLITLVPCIVTPPCKPSDLLYTHY